MSSDVVIAGAGPNGLMLACELSLVGVRPVVLERLPEPSTEPRANGLVGQVVRMFDRRALYERITGSTEPPKPALSAGHDRDRPAVRRPVAARSRQCTAGTGNSASAAAGHLCGVGIIGGAPGRR